MTPCWLKPQQLGAPGLRLPGTPSSNRGMNQAKVHVISWDIEGYGKVPKGALRDTIKMTTQKVVAQLVCKYLAKRVPWEYLTMTDIIGYVFRFQCSYMDTYEVYGRIVKVK